jgi:hypothetical protein
MMTSKHAADEQAMAALRGLKHVRDTFMGQPIHRLALDELIEALESGSEHVLLSWWASRRRSARARERDR